MSKAFVSIEIFAQLRGPMEELPNQIFALLHAYVSLQRIERYIQEEEVDDWVTTLKRKEIQVPLSLEDASKVWVKNGTFVWHAGASQHYPRTLDPDTGSRPDLQREIFALDDISLNFPSGNLSLVTGPTGSGKSSLLSALLGEMDCVSGSLHLAKQNRNVSYAAQIPFLEHATIRDNILYHQPFESARYQEVLEACALLPDLKILDAGDRTGMSKHASMVATKRLGKTEIGEKGVSLSGGQRARVALARAIYARSKVFHHFHFIMKPLTLSSQVVLLDDP